MPDPLKGRRSADLALIADADWAVAEARLAAIERLRAVDGLTCTAVDAEAARLGVSRHRLYAWMRRYRADPTIESLLPDRPGPRRGTGRLPAPVESIIADAIREFYLTAQKPKLGKLTAEVARRCRMAGLGAGPDARSIKARIDRVRLSDRVRAREGRKAADDRFRPVTAEYQADHALQIVQVDHTLADVIVVDELHRQPIQRPWLTLGIDVASSAVAGFHLTLEPPSALSVALALTHAVLPKDRWLAERGIAVPWPVQGIMDTLHLDNAKEFHSRALERGCRDHGIVLDHRPPRTPHYGGHIERLIGTMMGGVHLLPGTTFSNIQDKGAYDPERTAVMTLGEVERWLAIQIVAYNGTVHRRHLMPPALAYEEALGRRARPPAVPPDPGRFCMDFLPFELRMVRRDGIRLFNIHYWDPVLGVWAGQARQKMVVKYDPRDLSRVFLCDPEGTCWPIPYRDLRRPRITLWEHRRALEALRRRGRAAVDEAMLFDAVTAQRQLVADAAARTKQARRTRQRTADALGATRPAPCGLPAPDRADPDPPAPPGPVLPFAVEEWS